MKLKISLGILLLISLASCYNNSSITTRLKQIIGAETDHHVAIASETNKGQMLDISARAKIAGELVRLEVARTPQQQALGLMFRSSLAGDRGMYFPFETARIARFWMKNVDIPLDMIFLNGGRVIDIAENVPPCLQEPCPTYGPDTIVDGVIELRGGRAAELGLKQGDSIEIDFFKAP